MALFFWYGDTMNTDPRPADPMLRRYAINADGVVFFIESFASTGWYFAEKVSHLGEPLGQQLVSLKELSKMQFRSTLRDARAYASATYARHESMKARFGDLQ
jgi:hypothetical protein